MSSYNRPLRKHHFLVPSFHTRYRRQRSEIESIQDIQERIELVPSNNSLQAKQERKFRCLPISCCSLEAGR